MKPEQILDMQHDFVRRLRTEEFKNYIRNASKPIWTEEMQFPDSLPDVLGEQVRVADAYLVTQDMSALVQVAASKLDDTDKWDHNGAPSPYGIVRFERPLPMHDIRGKTMLIHWATWGPGSSTEISPLTKKETHKPGTLITLWNDAAFPDEVLLDYMRDLETYKLWNVAKKFLGRWAYVGTEYVADGLPLGAAELTVKDIEAVQASYDMGDDLPILPYTNPRRYIHALWLLLGGTVAKQSEGYIPRSAQKRVGQMPIPGRVTVITLRREAGSTSHGESMVEWSHRWMVRGHWRWQPYKDGVQRIWIHPYVKGPEDKPLVQSEKVYLLKR